jgi:hypothetical protein
VNAAKYGWRVLWRRAMIRDEDAWVRRPMTEYVSALVRDKPNASAAEQSCIEVAATAKGCVLLILNELKQHGFTHQKDGLVQLAPAGKDLRGFLSIELQALRTIGMERRAKPVTSLVDYTQAKKEAADGGAA